MSENTDTNKAVLKHCGSVQDGAVRVNMQSVQPKHRTPFHDVRDPSSSCRHCKQALDVCECIRGQNELLQRNVTNTYAVAAKLDTKALRDISALATQTAAVVAVLVATISYTSLLSPPSGWTAPEKARALRPRSFAISARTMCHCYMLNQHVCSGSERESWRRLLQTLELSMRYISMLYYCSCHPNI